MKFCIENIDSPMILKHDYISSLCIEDKQLFSKTVQSIVLHKQDNPLCAFSFWEGDKQLSDKDYYVIFDFFNLPVHNKDIHKNIALSLHKNMSLENEKKLRFEKLVNELNLFLMETLIANDSQFVSNKDVEISKVLNLLKLRPNFDFYDSLLENLINYFNLLNDLDLLKPFVFIGLKNFLIENELKMLYEFIISKKITLLLIDNVKDPWISGFEQNILLDKDFIEFRFEKQ